MKVKIVMLSVAAVLAGCATKGPSKGEIPSIETQTFNTKVPGETIQISKSCGWLWNRDKCQIETIEAVGIQPSVGATRVTQKHITDFACDNAKSNIVKYVFGERVTETRRNSSRNRQNENQKDRFKSATEIGPDVEMSPDDPNKDTNYSVREALVNTDIDVIKTQTFTSQGTLVGFLTKGAVAVDSKTISCTVRWNRNDAIDLRKDRGLISGM